MREEADRKYRKEESEKGKNKARKEVWKNRRTRADETKK